jgi:hypothetical protein
MAMPAAAGGGYTNLQVQNHNHTYTLLHYFEMNALQTVSSQQEQLQAPLAHVESTQPTTLDCGTNVLASIACQPKLLQY